jgi:hypothetical protein
VTAQRNSDMGQSFILPNTSSTTYTIRIVDASNYAINNSREYTFSLPASCGNNCIDPATEVTYTTFNPGSGILTSSPYKNKSVHMVFSRETLLWQASPNNFVTVIIRDIFGRAVLEKNSVAGNSGKGSINLRGLTAGIFIAEFNAYGLSGEKLLFAHP